MIDLSGLVIKEQKFEQRKQAKHAEINAAFTSATAGMTAGYPEAERISWPTQQAEVKAWQADNQAPTPLLDMIATARGIDRLECLQKAAGMVSAMEQTAAAIGLRQKLRDQIDTAEDDEELEQINWPSGETNGETNP